MNLGYPFVNEENIEKYTADVIIECTGSQKSIEKCIKILNPNGQICFFGNSNPKTEIKCVPYDIINKEIKIIGSVGNAFCFTKAINLAATMRNRYLNFEKLGIKTFSLENYREAFLNKKSGYANKVMFIFE